MKSLVLAVLLTLFAVPVFASGAVFRNVSISDVACSNKVQSNPDAHTRACALQCQKSGFGIWTKDGKFLKFDASGNAKAVQLLKSSGKSDHLRADVKGRVSGETLAVESLTLN